MHRLSSALCCTLLAGSALASDPCSAPMCADEGFGSSGRVAVAFDLGQDDADRGNAVVRVPGEDRLYVIGQVSTGLAGDSDFGVACLLGDGSPCPDFGYPGTGLTTVAMDFVYGGVDAAVAGAVVPWGVGNDWRLVVVGQVERAAAGDSDFGVALLRPDGSLETTAYGAGRIAMPFDLGADLTDLPAAVAVDGQGRVVVGGTVDAAAGDSDWGFTRLNADLTVDTSFGVNGWAVLDVSGLAVLHAMLLQPDGKVVAVGSRDFGDDQMAIARLNPDGSPDTYFGFLGQTVFDFDLGGSNDDSGWGVASDSEGRLVIVGEADFDTGACWAAARVLPDGEPDTTFSSGSAMRWDCFFNVSAGARGVALFPDGLSATVLETDYNGNQDFGVIWWRAGGLYSTFLFPFDLGGSNDDRPRSVLVQPDGRIVVAGRVVGSGGTLDFGVLRVWSHQVFADGFEGRGSTAEWDAVVTAR